MPGTPRLGRSLAFLPAAASRLGRIGSTELAEILAYRYRGDAATDVDRGRRSR